eukprot:scaffold262142_cov37-Tisochrysis_lutea.AAC.5
MRERARSACARAPCMTSRGICRSEGSRLGRRLLAVGVNCLSEPTYKLLTFGPVAPSMFRDRKVVTRGSASEWVSEEHVHIECCASMPNFGHDAGGRA